MPIRRWNRTVTTGAKIILAILLIPLELRSQNGQDPHSSGDQTRSSASTPVNKTQQDGTERCAPTPASTAPVKYSTSAEKHHVDLSWTASISTGVVKYNVHRCTQGSPCSADAPVIGSAKDISYTDYDVQPLQAYCYFVTAVATANKPDSAPSNMVYVVIPPSP